MESKKLQEAIAQEEALIRHAVAEVRWQQWGEKARQQAMQKVLIIINALQIRFVPYLQAQLIEEKSQQQKRKKSEQVRVHTDNRYYE